MKDTLANPIIQDEKKKQVLSTIAREAGFTESTLSFLSLLVDARRIDAIDEIVEAFETKYCVLTDTQVRSQPLRDFNLSLFGVRPRCHAAILSGPCHANKAPHVNAQEVMLAHGQGYDCTLLPVPCMEETTYDMAPCRAQVATLRSAVKLEQEQQFLIAKKLQELTGSKNIKLKPVIDDSLIAGFVVEYGSSQIDLSVKGQLDKISSELQEAAMAA